MWCLYEQLAQTYVLDKENRGFLQHANPWALHGIERRHEAVDRGLSEEPDPQLMAELQQVYLDVEGDPRHDRQHRDSDSPARPPSGSAKVDLPCSTG